MTKAVQDIISVSIIQRCTGSGLDPDPAGSRMFGSGSGRIRKLWIRCTSTSYHLSELHLGPCHGVEMWQGTNRHTNTQTAVINMHFAWLFLMRDVIITCIMHEASNAQCIVMTGVCRSLCVCHCLAMHSCTIAHISV